jgi:hypothetical protein
MLRSIVLMLQAEGFELVGCVGCQRGTDPFPLRLEEQGKGVSTYVEGIIDGVLDTCIMLGLVRD